MPAISVLMKPASSMCNMLCDYCFYRDEAANRDQASYGFMTEETLKNIIRRTLLRAENYICYSYQGGEPTLRGLDFFKTALRLQKKYNRNGLSIENVLQTNGSLIDENWCRFLAENHFLVGLSVDGTPSIHDSLRHTVSGDPTFGNISHAAKLMDEFHVEYNILTVVTSELAHNIRDVYAFYKEKGWKFQQYIACLDPIFGEHGANRYALTPEEYGHLLIELFELWIEDLQNGTQPYIRQFENYCLIAAGGIAESCDMRGTCGIQYVCEADGSVYPCDFFMLDEYRLGNFNLDLLPDLDRRRSEILFIEKSKRLPDKCRVCPYFQLCRGGCQRHRDPVPGQEYYENYFCDSYRLFFDHAYRDLTEIGQVIRRQRMQSPFF